MKLTEYVNQIQADGEVKVMRVIKTFPNSVGVETDPIKTEILELKVVDLNGSYITAG